MTLYKQRLFARLHRPAGDDGSDTGGTAVQDRGDSVLDTPEGDDEPEELADPFEEKGEKGKKGEKIEKSEADDAEDDEKKPKKDSRIPLSRHKDILAKERAQREMLEQRLAQYEKGQEVSRTNEELTALEDSILKMEKDYNRLLADGEVDKAAEMMTKIRSAERNVIETKAEMRSLVAESRARESARYDIALERIEENYPVLNPDADEFDKDTLQDVADLKQVYQGRGMTPTKALQAAVKKLLGQEGRGQTSATETNPRVTEKDVAAERRKAATSKAADAARRTPPSSRDVGMNSDKAGLTAKDIMSMSQKEFAELSEEHLAKLRGDAL